MKILIVSLNILFTIGLVPAAAGAMMSPMIFDAPGSTEHTGTWVFFIAIVSLPVVIIIGQVLSWILFARQHYKAALICSLLPLLNLIFLVGYFILAGPSF